MIIRCPGQGNMLKPKRQASDRDKVTAAAEYWMGPAQVVKPDLPVLVLRHRMHPADAIA